MTSFVLLTESNSRTLFLLQDIRVENHSSCHTRFTAENQWVSSECYAHEVQAREGNKLNKIHRRTHAWFILQLSIFDCF